MKLQGKVFAIGETQVMSEKFSKRDLIVEYAENPSYPEFIKVEAFNDKTSILDKFSVGQEVDVDFNLKGKPWTDKAGKTSYFNSLVIWKINSVGGLSNNVPAVTTPAGEEDDLPF